MKKVVINVDNDRYIFLVDCIRFDITLQVIKNHEVIAEFVRWDNWHYVIEDTFGSDKMPC